MNVAIILQLSLLINYFHTFSFGKRLDWREIDEEENSWIKTQSNLVQILACFNFIKKVELVISIKIIIDDFNLFLKVDLV